MSEDQYVPDPDALVRIPRLRIEQLTVRLASMAEITVSGLEAEVEVGAALAEVLAGASSLVETTVTELDGDRTLPDITRAALERAIDLDIDPVALTGSGKNGRVLLSDVEAAAD